MRVMLRIGGPFHAHFAWRVPCNIGVIKCMDGSASVSMSGRVEDQNWGPPAVSIEMQLTRAEATALRRDLRGAGIPYRDAWQEAQLYQTTYEVYATPHPLDLAAD